jgi:hypothetical protein
MDWKSEEGEALLAEAYTEEHGGYPAITDPCTDDCTVFAVLKQDLAYALDWPHFNNISWFQTWSGGWCLHGRPAALTSQDTQKSMNFELLESVTDPAEALVRAKLRVVRNPDRAKEKVRWYCPAHDWQEIVSRGEMHAGCPQCGGYYCEPWPRTGGSEE